MGERHGRSLRPSSHSPTREYVSGIFLHPRAALPHAYHRHAGTDGRSPCDGQHGCHLRVIAIDQQRGPRDFQRLALLAGALDEGFHRVWQRLVVPGLHEFAKFSDVMPPLDR